jgi:hypothetical protein
MSLRPSCTRATAPTRGRIPGESGTSRQNKSAFDCCMKLRLSQTVATNNLIQNGTALGVG